MTITIKTVPPQLTMAGVESLDDLKRLLEVWALRNGHVVRVLVQDDDHARNAAALAAMILG